jgi:hypothetical protein
MEPPVKNKGFEDSWVPEFKNKKSKCQNPNDK